MTHDQPQDNGPAQSNSNGTHDARSNPHTCLGSDVCPSHEEETSATENHSQSFAGPRQTEQCARQNSDQHSLARFAKGQDPVDNLKQQNCDDASERQAERSP
jgi:hypothetical protein